MDYLKIVIENLKKDKEIKNFISKNKLSDEDILRNISELSAQKENNDFLKNNNVKYLADPEGMISELTYENGVVSLHYVNVKEEQINIEKLFFPKLDDISEDEMYRPAARAIVLKKMMGFRDKFIADEKVRGLYLHGNFGTGKTFLLQYLALQLAKAGKSVIIAYYPELVSFYRSNLTTRESEVIFQKLKTVDVLMLDDIGSEYNTSFVRDDFLGSILNYRTQENLPVFMSSNLDLNDLKLHLQETNQGTDILKSERILTRVRYLMDVVHLQDKDYRVHKVTSLDKEKT